MADRPPPGSGAAEKAQPPHLASDDSTPQSSTPQTPREPEPADEVVEKAIEGEVPARISSSEDPEKQTPLKPTQTHATDASLTTTLSRTTTAPTPPKPWYRQPNPLRWGAVPPVPKTREVSHEHGASLLSRITFSWMTPLMTTGYKRSLEEKDIWAVNPARSVVPITARLREAFARHVTAGSAHPLWWALHDTFRKEFYLGGVLALVYSVLQVMTPFTLRFLIQFATDAWQARRGGTEAPAIGVGIGLVVGVAAMQAVQSLAANHFLYSSMVIGGQLRGSLMGMLFEKSMVLSGRARAGGAAAQEGEGEEEKDLDAADASPPPKSKWWQRKPKSKKKAAPKASSDGWGNGRIVNMMSVDVGRIDLAAGMFHMVWSGPFSAIITLALLIVNLSYSALAGFALLVLGTPLLTRVMRSLFTRRKEINMITDKRVSLTQEILAAVRFVKFFAWEGAFLERLQKLRDSEISGIQVLLALRNAILAVSMSLPVLAAVLSFVTYSLTNNSMQNPARVFSSLALFNSLRIPLNLLPTVLGQAVDAWSSMGRIEEFLRAEEQTEDLERGHDKDAAMELRGASFTWEESRGGEKKGGEDGKKRQKGSGGGGDKQAKKDQKKAAAAAKKDAADKGASEEDNNNNSPAAPPFHLDGLSLKLGRSELVAVIGGVGSGKSSLLAALAGDMRKTGGHVVLSSESRALCPQYAWIQNTTVRENITFGKAYDAAWYGRVVEACALGPDLDMLPQGDATEIGERGITISGGQKQRLNVARAIYFDADVVLMDDPLSAVDAHVGRHIFDKAILGLLGDKCRVLATHQLWVLHRCDRIVWMDGGAIRAVGGFDELMAGDPAFCQMMESSGAEKKEEGEEAKKDGAAEEGEDDGDGDDDEEDEGAKKEAAKEAAKKARKQKKAVALMQAEERAVASVPWATYAAYIRASGSLVNLPVLLALLVLTQCVNVASSIWLSAWTADRWGLPQGVYIGGYAAFGAGQAVVMFVFSVSLSMLGTRASKVLLGKAVWSVLRAPMSFFDTTPLGRITNRFSRDVDVVDNNLSDAIRMFSSTMAMIISSFVLVIVYYYYFAAAVVPLAVVFVVAASYYRASAREVKRFEAVLRSSVFARFSEGLTGVASIRAYGLQAVFSDKLGAAIDEMNGAYFLTFANQRWLATRLDVVGILIVFVTGILVVTSRFSVDPSVAGLVLSYVLSIVQMIQFTVRQLAEVENGMNSVERLLHYGTRLEQEAALEAPARDGAKGGAPAAGQWPSGGEIVFDKVEMRYRDGLPLVLQGLSLHVGAGERVGIVGRTGAGKSSIVAALFRLAELAGGSITIDGVDIADVGLHALRAGLAIIPQDPTLFKGTVRSNLDPFGQHSDMDLWSALRRADLVHDHDVDPASSSSSSSADVVPASPTHDPSASSAPRITLDTPVVDDGLNFSLGQRQLMALARALVRDARVIICDEATSSVDVDTDARIQATISEQFAGRTLLCIAHRLRTIIGYDRVVVMDRGVIAEVGSPRELWEHGGIFRGMCERGGITAGDIPSA